jgi:hypothetical protein
MQNNNAYNDDLGKPSSSNIHTLNHKDENSISPHTWQRAAFSPGKTLSLMVEMRRFDLYIPWHSDSRALNLGFIMFINFHLMNKKSINNQNCRCRTRRKTKHTIHDKCQPAHTVCDSGVKNDDKHQVRLCSYLRGQPGAIYLK